MPERAAAVAMKGRTVRVDSEQAVFAKQMTEKAEQKTNCHVIKATRR